MNRTERVLALLDGHMTPAQACNAGVTARDALDAVTLASLDLELTRSVRPSMGDAVRAWLTDLDVPD